MTAKTLIKSLAETGQEVNDVFTNANAELCANNEAGMFVTAWMGVLDLRTGLVSFANAGHNPPLVRHVGGVLSDVDRFVGDAPQFDDITMLCLKFEKRM